MTPSLTQYFPKQLNFGSIEGRKVIANFEGGRITSDAGIVLMAELDKKLKITARFAHGCNGRSSSWQSGRCFL
jgi:hypothetical protein